jgi:hypothetical protein
LKAKNNGETLGKTTLTPFKINGILNRINNMKIRISKSLPDGRQAKQCSNDQNPNDRNKSFEN